MDQYLALAKSTRGAGCAAIVLQATADPKVFVFGELLALPSIQDLKESHAPVYRLLQIFAHETLHSYKQNVDLPSLDANQLKKLRMLTLVALARTHTAMVLPYAVLLRELDMDTVQDVEHVIIEAISVGIVKGRLDHEQQCFHVTDVIGRDPTASEMAQMIVTLEKWLRKCDTTLNSLQEKSNHAQQAKDATTSHAMNVSTYQRNKLHTLAMSSSRNLLSSSVRMSSRARRNNENADSQFDYDEYDMDDDHDDMDMSGGATTSVRSSQHSHAYAVKPKRLR